MPMLPDEGGNQGGKDGFAQFRAADFGQIGQGNADDEGGLDPFAQSNDECLQHLVENLVIANRVATRYATATC